MKIQYFVNEPAIFNVIRRLDYASLECLIQEDTNIVNKPRPSDGFTPLHCAVSRNSVIMVQELLAAGSDPDKQCKTGTTPLDLALRSADMDPSIIKGLIKKGGSFCSEDVESYYQQRIARYGDKMSIEDLTDGLIKTKGQLQDEPLVISQLGLVNSSSLLSSMIDDLQKLLLSSDLNKDEGAFSRGMDIERLCSPMEKNLLGWSPDEIDYYN